MCGKLGADTIKLYERMSTSFSELISGEGVLFIMGKITPFMLDIDRYMLDCSAKGLSPKTLKSYEQTLRLFARYCHEVFDIDDSRVLKAEHLNAYIRDVRERGKFKNAGFEEAKNHPTNRKDFGKPVSETTIANYVRNIKAYYSYLYEERWISTNAMKDVSTPKPKRKMKQLLEDNEVKQFFRAFDVTRFDQYRDWIIAQLIFDCGARISELTATVTADFDLRNNALLLRETKNRKERIVYYSDTMKRLLRSWFDYKDRYSNADYAFPTNRGTRVRVEGIERSFRLRAADCKTHVTPHLLRNNFAKRYLINGGDLATLSRLLGHASLEVTANIYLDFADKEIMRKYQQHSPLQNL